MAEVIEQQPAQAPEAHLDGEGMDRDVGFLGLLWASEGSIIGSGWLFGALTAAAIAGPSAIIAWFAASLIVIVLALVHAELGGLFPVSGGTSRFPHYAFGSLAGGTFGLIAYFGTFGSGGILGGIGVFKHVLPDGGNDDLGLYGGLVASVGWSL